MYSIVDVVVYNEVNDDVVVDHDDDTFCCYLI